MGPLTNINNFFMCGVPGGIDYAMLVAVKHGWIEPLTEKNVNAGVNVWLRAPALIMIASFSYIQCRSEQSHHAPTTGPSMHQPRAP